MTGWLLDTNIVSQLAPDKSGRPRVSEQLALWLRDNSDALFISAISIVEVTHGIAGLRRSGARKKADDLGLWLDRIVQLYAGRVLPVDVAVSRTAGMIDEQARSSGRHPGFADILIAATAQTNRLTLLTQNVRHFEPLDLSIDIIDPLSANMGI